MFGRIFGQGKDEPDQAVCAECGRTLLAGERTQKVIDANGDELIICSLCGQTHAPSGADAMPTSPVPANSGRERERETRDDERDPRTESNAFWKALKDKDAEIERLQAQLARLEAEKQELAGRPARAQGATVPAGPLIPSAAGPAVVAAAAAAPPTGDSSEPGERTWGETPAEFAAELAALRDETPTPTPATSPNDVMPVGPPQREMPAGVFEDTQPIPTLTDEELAERPVAQAPAPAPSRPATPRRPSPRSRSRRRPRGPTPRPHRQSSRRSPRRRRPWSPRRPRSPTPTSPMGRPTRILPRRSRRHPRQRPRSSKPKRPP